ncbi:MAG: hypothetical protein OEY23_22970 [Acidimicrobiia bacterium]|nr:hypothetical protein [Acidimicrobiia bacterium]
MGQRWTRLAVVTASFSAGLAVAALLWADRSAIGDHVEPPPPTTTTTTSPLQCDPPPPTGGDQRVPLGPESL